MQAEFSPRSQKMMRLGETWESPSGREGIKRKAEGELDKEDAGCAAPPEQQQAAASAAAQQSEMQVGAIEFPTLDEDDTIYDQFCDRDEEWFEEGSDKDPEVIKGKDQEIDNMDSFGVYELLPRTSQDWKDFKWLSVKWVIQKRGGKWRCRLVGRDFKARSPEMPGLFTCGSNPTTGRVIDFYAVKHRKQGFAAIIGDATCAYFHAFQEEKVVCECPEEIKARLRKKGLDDDVVMVLLKKLYGERTASVRFEEFFSSILVEELGFDRCAAQPQFYIHRATKIALELHQDDIHGAGPPRDLLKFQQDLSEKIRMKWSPLLVNGMRYSHLKNYRVISPEGTMILPNPKYSQDIIQSLGLEGAKPAPTPIINTRSPEDTQYPLQESEVKLYRHCVSVARFLRNYLPASNYAVKELSHGLAHPNEADMARLRRFAKWLKGEPGLGIWFPVEGDTRDLFVDTDSDWAADKVTRRSISSHMIHCGGCLLADSAKAQTVEAQSSGKAETYAGAGGVSPTMLFKVVLEFFEFEVGTPKLRMDSKAAKSICTRYGVGLVRHLEVKILWIQSLTKAKRLQVWKVPCEENIADLGTKALAKKRFEELLIRANIKRLDSSDIPETKVVGQVALEAGSFAPMATQEAQHQVENSMAVLTSLLQVGSHAESGKTGK